MPDQLTASELKELILSVFSPGTADHRLGLLIDVPDETVPDTASWKIRRAMAISWAARLNEHLTDLGLDDVSCYFYRNVHINNADLPSTFYVCSDPPENIDAGWILNHGEPVADNRLFSNIQLILAPTQFSTTAPLKNHARRYGFRAATMPGFSVSMITALKLDYERINRRVNQLKKILDTAESMQIDFLADREIYTCRFDLRHRLAHCSGGRFPEPGTAGNLPSGECYIVPYEGELQDVSATSGILPVQFKNEVVLYRLEENRAVDVLSHGPFSDSEKDRIQKEPAYANIAEIGFGVLHDFGIRPVGEILLDEKLGLHIAFGRSDHFGGITGPDLFSSPEAVCHIDRLYVPEIQDRIRVSHVDVFYPDAPVLRLMDQHRYAISWE